ncbi:hypothetical protein D9611_004082 [Ephemerocybe angulata]|uniref:F-box domain-containing protein n=1 Tax=Ephemerocybe angulata TaxID=980116 RepID=A0A8H5BLB4_9AGAR|nr:hypothetical protein D9611_004082 [Tulosesus angulatus]
MAEVGLDRPNLTEDDERIYQLQDERLACLMTRKANLLDELSEIESNIKDILRERRERVYSASSIAPLPNEILSTIFLEVQRNGKANGVRATEVTMSHVCSRWRDIALTLPPLWNVFQHCQARSRSSVQSTEERLRAYLERSGDLPFDLWIDFTTKRNLRGHRLLSLLHIVIPHLHRCRVLHLLSDQNHPLHEFQKSLATASVPLLEVCAICPDYLSPLGHIERSQPNIFKNGAPSLKYLRLDETTLLSIRPPLDSVVCLRIERRRAKASAWIPNSILDTILSLPNLQTLSISANVFHLQGKGGSTPTERIMAKKLENLRSADATLTAYILSHTSTPSLRSLTLQNFDLNEGSMTLPDELDFLSLRTLTLTNPKWRSRWSRYDVRNLKKVIAASPNVEEVILWGDSNDSFEVLYSTFKAILGVSSWTKIKRATFSMNPRNPQETGYFEQFVQRNPELELLRLPATCFTDPKFLEWVPSRVELQPNTTKLELPLPLCSLPGLDWLDTEGDLFGLN